MQENSQASISSAVTQEVIIQEQTVETKRTSGKPDRVKEARRWLLKAKACISESRNLRTDLKKGLIEAVDNLYSIVKMGSTDTVKTKTGKDTTYSNIEEPNIDIQELLASHGASLEAHKQEMKVLRETMERTEMLMGKGDKIVEEVGEMKKTLADIGDKMAELKTPTYAEATIRPTSSQAHKIEPNFAVIVTSETTMDNDSEFTTKVRSALDAKNNGLQIQSMRKIKDSRIVLKCNSKKEMEKTVNQLKKDNTLKVEEAKNRNPLVLLKDVMAYNTDADIETALRNQNEDLMKDLRENEKTVAVKYRRRARNPLQSHVVLQVAPRLWQRLTEVGRIYVDSQRVHVKDQSPLIQCSVCLAYGHGRKHCTEQVQVCHHCGGPHVRAECPAKKAGTQQSCVNCRRAKNKDDAHAVYSDDCPIRRKWDALARTTTAYC